ncbi:MAG: hypothetical protein H0U57_00380 [Tatlockia sp.]|nr:hypothetical protein [Tatlockia sp.]
MQINWPLITLLFFLSLPGILIAIPRLITVLLPANSEALQKKISRYAMTQAMLMTFLMSLTGAILSLQTGLNAPLLNSLLQSHTVFELQKSLLPTLLYTLSGFIVFLILYYGLIGSILDKKTMELMKKIRSRLGPEGCILYAVPEEIINRWGLMNLFAFFGVLCRKVRNFPRHSLNHLPA